MFFFGKLFFGVNKFLFVILGGNWGLMYFLMLIKVFEEIIFVKVVFCFLVSFFIVMIWFFFVVWCFVW